MQLFKPRRLKKDYIIVVIFGLLCFSYLIHPGISHAGLFDWLFKPKTEQKKTPEKSQVKPPEKVLTINKIDPDVNNKTVKLIFTEDCGMDELKGLMRIFPHTKINWSQSSTVANTVIIKGDFKPGQDYTIVFPENASCKGIKYTKALNTFRMPDLPSEIVFAEKETLIERDSRQMVHSSITNVDELLFRGLKIPTLLVPFALEHQNQPYDALKAALLKKNEMIRKLDIEGADKALKNFFNDVTEESQLFFAGKEKNKQQKYSMPLGFRSQKEKGVIEIISLKSNRSDQNASDVSRVFRITDIGITYKISEGSLLIWLTSLNTGKPLGNVALAAYLKKSDTIVWLGKTDANGILFVKDMENKTVISMEGKKAEYSPVSLKDIYLVLAASSTDTSFIEIKQTGTLKPDWVQQTGSLPAKKRPMKRMRHITAGIPDKPVSPSQEQRLLRGHLFTERGIYRPGERVFFKGTVREYKNGEILPPSGVNAIFTITNSKDEEIYKKEIALSEFGTANDYLDTKSFFPLGTYSIKMQFQDSSASTTFEVQEFRAPRHFVEIISKRVTKKDETYVNIKKEINLLTFDISGKYYAGGPVKHGKVRWKIFYSGTNFQKKEYPDYVFGNAVAGDAELIESGESMLDEKGRVVVTIPVDRAVLSGLYGVEIAATVVDFDGRASTETALYQEEPEYIIGISSHGDTVKAGDPQVLKVIVLDKSGKRVGKGTVDVTVLRGVSTYVRKRNDEGNVYWDYKNVLRKELSTNLNIENSVATFDFDFIYGGNYLLKFNFKGKDGKEYTSSAAFNVEGYFYGYEYESRERNFEKLSAVSERKGYSDGETIRIFINPHKELSSLLMTIERGGILRYKNINLSPGQKYIDIPVEKEFEPNIYVSLFGIVARGEFPVHSGQFDENPPGFLFGVVNVEIKKELGKLNIEINKDAPKLKYEPSSEVTLSVSTKDKSGKGVETEVALCVVDESVLALTGYKTPVLDSLSKFIVPLSVFTGEERLELLRQTPYRFIRNEPLTGGDGGEGKDSPSAKIRKDFRPVAYFNPSLKTDKSGNAHVKFTLPDAMTTYRVYAVACDKGSQIGSYKRDLLAVKDFYLEPGTPRFFTKGDRFKFFVSAFNKTDVSGTGEFDVGKNEFISLSSKHKSFQLMSLDRSLLSVDGEAVKPGTANLRFVGEFNSKKDIVEIKVPVKSGYLQWSDVVYGSVKGSSKITYAFPQGTEKINWKELEKDEIRALLTVSGSPFIRMSQGLRYLLAYPYGCVEQTSSRVLPLSALRGLIKDGFIADISISETDKFLKPGIERLLAMQTENGGFGYWPGYSNPDMWGTIYAASALSYAKLAGFEIPADKMNKAMEYIKRSIREAGKNDSTFRGYAIYILALNNMLEDGVFREVYKDLKDMTREGALLALLAGKIGKYLPLPDIEQLTRSVLERRWEGKESYAFYARYREPAIALIAATAILKNDPVSGKLAKQLLDGVNKQGIWTSTSDTGWALIALGEYFKGMSFTNKPVRVTVRQEGLPEISVNIGPENSYTYNLDSSKFVKKPEIYISVDGERDVVYMLSLTFPRVDYASQGYARGFLINKTIENTDGSKNIKVGDIVKINIDIHAENGYNYLVIDDPLPAGLVAVNTAIKTEERPGGKRKRHGDEEDEDGYWGEWDYTSGSYRFVPNYFEIRDDRVLIFKDRVWKGRYKYSYYARAVCEGDFVMPSTKIQLMYEPDIASFTPVGRVVIEGR